MKRFKLLLLLLSILTLGLFVSCEDTGYIGGDNTGSGNGSTGGTTTKIQLDTPINIRVTEFKESIVVFCDLVEDTASYRITVYQNGKYKTRVTQAASQMEFGIAIIGLEKGEYTLSIKAIASDDSTLLDSLESESVSFTVTGNVITPSGKYTITFDSNGGTSVTSETVESGSTVTKPEDPTRTGYRFVEWQLDGKTYEFTEAVNKNITLKAVWEKENSDGVTNLSAYYKSAEGFTGTVLKTKLRTIISTGVTTISYDALKTKLPFTDADPTDSSKMLLFFSHEQVNAKWDNVATWNREHVWPKSQGWFENSGAGSDIHHIRPEDPTVNSIHGNLPYGEVSGGKTLKYNNKVVAYYTSSYFEPLDEFKGDVARIIFYLLVRYSQSDSNNITKVAQSMSMLLEWHANDPVDDFEKLRNERSYQVQKNRNPFIDYPEFANMIWA